MNIINLVINAIYDCGFSELVEKFNKQKRVLAKNDQTIDRIDIYIHSAGGDVYAGLGIYDFIRNLIKKYEIRVISNGNTMSAGLLVFLAADKRLSYPNSTFLYHDIHSWVAGDVKEIENNLKEIKRLKEIIQNIYKERIGEKNWKYLEKMISKKTKDYYFGVDKAKELNLVNCGDEI